MDTRIKEWSKLKFCDPAKALPKIRKWQEFIAASNLDDKIKNLRTRKLRKHLEKRIASLFCYGMGIYLNKTIFFAPAPNDNSDYDAVAKRIEGSEIHYTPIQIKEVVPERLNPKTDINQEIAKLCRYPVSNDTVVVMHINRAGLLNLSSIKLPELNIAELWLLGASSPDQNKWFIAGNLLDKPAIFEFNYPV
ncbi:MAG: hypothetical protein LWW94_00640 [Candidatus Desulfofervidaceae bacterium]|nr:hypothetical protein [Candidatus Desulfofervidaceae bacterium]